MGKSLVFGYLSSYLPGSLCINIVVMFSKLPMSELLITLGIPNALTKMK